TQQPLSSLWGKPRSDQPPQQTNVQTKTEPQQQQQHDQTEQQQQNRQQSNIWGKPQLQQEVPMQQNTSPERPVVSWTARNQSNNPFFQRRENTSPSPAPSQLNSSKQQHLFSSQ